MQLEPIRKAIKDQYLVIKLITFKTGSAKTTSAEAISKTIPVKEAEQIGSISRISKPKE